MRRVVTGQNEAGRATIVSDGEPPRHFEHRHPTGMSQTLVWSTEAGAPADPSDPTPAVADFVPSPGATRFITVVFPPDAAFAAPDFDPAAAGAEARQACPGLADTFEPENPGMHTSPTVDYAIVLDGEICLDLDGGRETRLRRGDVVVQNATRHAWRNRADRPATVAFVLVGAEPDSR